MTLVIKNIGSLIQTEKRPRRKVSGRAMASLSSINNAYLLMEDELIGDFGPMSDLKKAVGQAGKGSARVIDAGGGLVCPSFCDSHSHVVYAGSREKEFAQRIKGLSYLEIAKKGGGILSTVREVRSASEDELFEQSMQRVDEIIGQGTGAVEIKSGYGLTLEDELKMLRVIKRIGKGEALEVKATFLGAHALPPEYLGKRKAYLDMVVEEMIPLVAEEGLADFIDVFCEKGFFTREETDRVLTAGLEYGLRPKIHANQLSASGGAGLGVQLGAVSVDHLEHITKREIAALKGSGTMATILPGASFFLGLPGPPVRQMMEMGLPICIGSDYNPGSSPCGSMKLMMSLACINHKMLPAEAITAATINGAYAMGIEKTHGTIARGKKANVFITKRISDYHFLPYAYGSDVIETTILNGRVQ